MRIRDSFEILEESISDIVYHATTERGIHGIISQNRFVLSSSFSHESETGKKLFFLSTSRSRIGNYVRNMASSRPTVILTLDGRKLNHNFSGHPFDYFKNRDAMISEYEDRVFSDDPVIKNAKNYIKEISVIGGLERRLVIQLAKFCKTGGIKLSFYNNRSDFENRRPPIPLGEYLDRLNSRSVDSTMPPAKNDPLASGIIKILKGVPLKPKEVIALSVTFSESPRAIYLDRFGEESSRDISRLMRYHGLRSVSELRAFVLDKLKEAA